MSMRRALWLTVLLFLFMAVPAHAVDFEPRGSVIVSGIMSDVNNTSTLTITNISGCDVDCRVTVYDHDGNDVSNLCTVYSGSANNSVVMIASGTGSFSLPGGASRFVNVQMSSSNAFIVGHAVVEWSSTNSNVRKALVVTGHYIFRHNGAYERAALEVIGGQPF